MSFIISLLATLTLTQAAEPVECSYIVERSEGTQLQRIWTDSTQTCTLSIHPMEAYYDMIYRDYSFSNDGMFQVFNSFGPGEDSSDTGAREFFLFPRSQSYVTHTWDTTNQRLIVVNVTGDEFVFDTRKARLMSISRGVVKVASAVEPKNRGGVEFEKFPGVILDGGFSLGASPTGKKNNSSVFQDAKGKKCSVKNSEIFKYTSSGDAVFKYRSDSSLKTFLQGRCAGLSL